MAAPLLDRVKAVEHGRPNTAPPLVAMHRIPANVIQVKSAWAFALAQSAEPNSDTAALDQGCHTVLQRAQDEGLIEPKADLDWVRRVYYALLAESLHGDVDSAEIAALHGTTLTDANTRVRGDGHPADARQPPTTRSVGGGKSILYLDRCRQQDMTL